MTPEERFRRSSDVVSGAKLVNRIDLYGDHAEIFARDRAFGMRLFSVGDFVSRLWARFGQPDSVQEEGFDYALVDRETGMLFNAYSAGSGPAYGGIGSPDEPRTREVLEAFECWIAGTPPVDCVIEYGSDFGRLRSGARADASGTIVPFDEEVVPRGVDPREAKSGADCGRIAASWQARDPDHEGWEACLGLVLSGKRMRGEDIITISETDDDDLAVLVERDDELVRVPLRSLAPTVVRGVARLWLQAWQARPPRAAREPKPRS